MSTTLTEVAGFLDENEIRYKRSDEEIRLAYRMENYKNPEGRKSALLRIDLSENGECLRIACPRAFVADGKHTDVTLKACSIVQWKSKLVRFEFVQDDLSVHVAVEIPLDDSSVSARQVVRSIFTLLAALERWYVPLAKTHKTGKLHKRLVENPGVEHLASLLAKFPERVVEEAVARARERRTSDSSDS